MLSGRGGERKECSLPLQHFRDSVHRSFNILITVESAQADISFTARAETATGSTYNSGLIKKDIKDLMQSLY